MKAPLSEKQITKIHSHQYLALHGPDDLDLNPYRCPNDMEPLFARTEGLYCLTCGYSTDTIVYWGKMNSTGMVKRLMGGE